MLLWGFCTPVHAQIRRKIRVFLDTAQRTTNICRGGYADEIIRVSVHARGGVRVHARTRDAYKCDIHMGTDMHYVCWHQRVLPSAQNTGICITGSPLPPEEKPPGAPAALLPLGTVSSRTGRSSCGAADARAGFVPGTARVPGRGGRRYLPLPTPVCVYLCACAASGGRHHSRLCCALLISHSN